MKHTDPGMRPAGPIDVGNMRLKGIGSLKSLPVTGDFMSYFLTASFIWSLVKPSS